MHSQTIASHSYQNSFALSFGVLTIKFLTTLAPSFAAGFSQIWCHIFIVHDVAAISWQILFKLQLQRSWEHLQEYSQGVNSWGFVSNPRSHCSSTKFDFQKSLSYSSNYNAGPRLASASAFSIVLCIARASKLICCMNRDCPYIWETSCRRPQTAIYIEEEERGCGNQQVTGWT